MISWRCQIGIQGPHLCEQPCKLYMPISIKAFFDLKLHVLQSCTSDILPTSDHKFNMDPEWMISSAEASGFPQFMRKVLNKLDFEDLLKTRLISMTFYKFLMDKNQRKIWVGAASKVFTNVLQKTYYVENFSGFLRVYFWNTNFEELKNSLNKRWIEVFENVKVKEIAKIPEIIKICHLLKEIENRKSSTSMQMSSIFTDNLELHKLMVSVTPTMWAYLHYILVNN